MANLSSILFASLFGAAAITASAAESNMSTYCVPHQVTPNEQYEIFEGWVHEFYLEREIPKAFHTYVMADFIQHNVYEPPYGALPSETYLHKLFGNSSIGIEILHQGFDGGIGWVHWRLDNAYPRPAAIADIFRFNESCIQEHWDVIQELPADATNPIALF